MSTPRFIVTCDQDIRMDRLAELREAIEQWLVSGKPVALLSGGLHVASQQPDGTWVRICHDHSQSDIVYASPEEAA